MRRAWGKIRALLGHRADDAPIKKPSEEGCHYFRLARLVGIVQDALNIYRRLRFCKWPAAGRYGRHDSHGGALHAAAYLGTQLTVLMFLADLFKFYVDEIIYLIHD